MFVSGVLRCLKQIWNTKLKKMTPRPNKSIPWYRETEVSMCCDIFVTLREVPIATRCGTCCYLASYWPCLQDDTPLQYCSCCIHFGWEVSLRHTEPRLTPPGRQILGWRAQGRRLEGTDREEVGGEVSKKLGRDWETPDSFQCNQTLRSGSFVWAVVKNPVEFCDTSANQPVARTQTLTTGPSSTWRRDGRCKKHDTILRLLLEWTVLQRRAWGLAIKSISSS